MNKFTRDDVKSLLVLVICIALIVVAIRFFIYLLPVIIIALVLWLVYDSYKRNMKTNQKDKSIKEAQVIREKRND